AFSAPGPRTRHRRPLPGPLRPLRRPPPLLARALATIDVGPQPAIGRVTQRAVERDLDVLDLTHQPRHAPPRRLIDTRQRGEWGGRRFVLLERREQIAKRSFVESRPHMTDRLELALAIDAEKQRAEGARTAT